MCFLKTAALAGYPTRRPDRNLLKLVGHPRVQAQFQYVGRLVLDFKVPQFVIPYHGLHREVFPLLHHTMRLNGGIVRGLALRTSCAPTQPILQADLRNWWANLSTLTVSSVGM